MPQINRVRIINFSYNNNNRNIVDETFDFMQGENALLNLKNGGGKSVLVQLLLQPVIPKTKLMSRRIEDFFRGKKTPAYILIEWKLEDQGGYLLTGVALANKETQVRDQDEFNNSLKYFTFTSHYRSANLFDIEYVPLVNRKDDCIYIETFKDARKELTLKEKNHDYQVMVFSDEESADYRRHLESFNIFQDEWKSIILKINESEGGVIEIFEKAKTSQQLMSDWILKSVEKVVNNEDQDQKKLEQMLENLVEEMIKNEQFIYEKDLYNAFLAETESILAKLEELVQSLDQETALESKIARMYYFLKDEIARMSEEIQRQNEVMVNSEEALKWIDLEERSKAYYDELEKYEALTVKLSEAKEALKQLEDRVSQNEHEIRVQKAAREYGDAQKIETKIAGLEEEINRIKFHDDNHEKIRNLEYSLKLAYEKLIADLKVRAEDFRVSLKALDVELDGYDSRIKELDLENSDLQDKRGALRTKVEQFEESEGAIREQLGLTYERNLLGEIEKDYFDLFFQRLEESLANLAGEKERNGLKFEELKEEYGNAKQQVEALRLNEQDLVVKAASIEGEISRYNDLEAALKPTFERYGLDFERRFHHQENQLFMEEKIKELQRKQRELDLNSHTHSDTIAALNNGTLHVSKEFRQWLINEDIVFETGENYLRKQPANIRNNLVQQNPILPFAFLLYDEDLERLASMDIGCNPHQMVPLFSYSDLDKVFTEDGQKAYVQEHLHLLCLYDNRMIDADNLGEYLAELQRELADVNEQVGHYREQLETAGEDRALIRQFIYDKNDLYELERQMEQTLVKIQSIKQEIARLEDRQENIMQEQNSHLRRNNEIDREHQQGENRAAKVHAFIKQDEEYRENSNLLKAYSTSIDTIAKEKNSITELKKSLGEKRNTISGQSYEVATTIRDKETKYLSYKAAPDGILIEGDISALEERLNVLRSNITSSLDRLEKDLESAQNELNYKRAKLSYYQMEESQYAGVAFDQLRLEGFEKNHVGLLGRKKEADDDYSYINTKLQVSVSKCESAEAEVKKLADAPIAKELIKLNFKARREAEKVRKQAAVRMMGQLRDDSAAYQTLTGRIDVQVEVLKHEVSGGYEVEEDINRDYAKLYRQLDLLKKVNDKYERNITRKYSDTKAQFKDKNKHIDNILESLDTFVEGTQSDKNKYYYLAERMLQSSELLLKLIRAREQRLLDIEKDQKVMVQQSYLHAKRVFGEIQKIAENSSIKIEGKNRPIQMLKIDMESLSETEDENIGKIKSYIDTCVTIIKQDMKEEKKLEDIRKKISKYMSTKELLNVLSDLGKMKISAYKIDINARNSGYKSWEQVMKENSGGERFVSFFAVLVALMSYTRTSMKLADDYQRNNDTKVLIMDNPFGPISSEHLLRPLFNIAKKYNTQLICLTDLKQNSILNCFNLIYMIKIRQNVFGTNEYIQLEQQIKEDTDLKQDEMLEKAVFKVEEVQQISMFE